jgi:chorismate mutase/prephenate dehydratase
MRDPLRSIRDRIDALDRRLVKLLSARARLAQRIGRLKEGAAYRPEREAQVLRSILAENRGPLPEGALARLFTEIMSACRALEDSMTAAYLGPQGTFSQEAAVKHFGGLTALAPCSSIDEVFRRVGRLAGIRKVYSHAQSLSQCQQWLARTLPRAERVAVVSNAEAARLAARERGAAAIGPRTAAALYGLKLLARNIEDEAKNTTRFLVIAEHAAAPSGRDKTSLVMSTRNVPGAMHELLTPLAANQVSMTRLESRPSRTGLWEYVFYVDIEGHQRDPGVARALAELKQKASLLKILGSYPAAVA